ncbi:unnamed protein product [Rotaria magnacalcarata]
MKKLKGKLNDLIAHADADSTMEHDTVDQAIQTEIEPRTSPSHRTYFVCQKIDASPSVVLSEEQQMLHNH